MDEQTTETTIEADASLINPNPIKEESEVEAPIAIHEKPQEASAPTDEAEVLERPDYYPEKFWNDDGPDVEKLAKSYAELEKKFKSGKHKAPEQYDISSLSDQGLDSEDPTVAIYQDWAKENGISQDAFEDLAGRVLTISKQEQESAEYDSRAEMQKLGNNAKEKIQMVERNLMKASLTNTERDSLAQSLNSADAINAFVKYHQSLTNENIPIAPAVNQPDMTRADLEVAIADPRWKTDAPWRTKIEQKWMQANA